MKINTLIVDLSNHRNICYSETEKLFVIRKKINLFLFALHFFYLLYFGVHNLFLPATIALCVVIYMVTMFFLKDQYKSKTTIFISYSFLLLANYLYEQYFTEKQFVFHYLPILLSVLLFFDLKNERKFSFVIIGYILLFYILAFLPISYSFNSNPVHDKTLYYVNLILSIGITLYELYYITERFIFIKKDMLPYQENTISRLIEFARNDETEFINYHNFHYPEFNNKLLELASDLTITELATCAYVKLKFSSKEIAQYTKNSIGAIETRKYRIRKKLNISNEKDFQTFVSEL